MSLSDYIDEESNQFKSVIATAIVKEAVKELKEHFTNPDKRFSKAYKDHVHFLIDQLFGEKLI